MHANSQQTVKNTETQVHRNTFYVLIDVLEYVNEETELGRYKKRDKRSETLPWLDKDRLGEQQLCAAAWVAQTADPDQWCQI
jgi:hypothetical protein